MPKVKLSEIFPNLDQPRKQFRQKDMNELLLSIKENGLLQPIIVTKRKDNYMIIAGERRYRACTLAGLKKIDVRILKAGNKKIAELALLENLQREDLNSIEEALGYKKLMDMGMSMEETAKKMGMKQTWRIKERLDLLRLAPTFRQCLIDKFITPSQAYEMSRLPHNKQSILYEKIREGKAENYNKLRSLANALLFPPPQQVIFGGEIFKAELLIGKKYDALINRLAVFISRSFNKKDLKILAKVTQSTITINIKTIDLIIKELRKIQKAMIQAQSAKEVL